MFERHPFLPISTRRAFALAFDLALRRDLGHSLLVPLLLRAPWVLAPALLPPLEEVSRPRLVIGLTTVALIGDWLMLLVIGAMLRFRAQSVFNTSREVRPAPASDCYARGFRRIPWLLITELLRNFWLGVAASISILPGVFLRLRVPTAAADLGRDLLLLVAGLCLTLPAIFLAFRLAVATEAVVLHERDLAGAFLRSFRIMKGRFERWIEMIAASAVLVLSIALLAAFTSVALPTLSLNTVLSLFWLLVTLITPVIQYAWTFFYLRLVELDEPGIEVGPTYAAAGAPPGAAPREGTEGLELLPPAPRPRA
jgi:hypothetical protein